MRIVRGWLKAFFASAPDPRQTFANAYQRQRDLLARVQQALVEVGGSKQKLDAKAVEVRAKLPDLEEQARRSLIAGREDLARLALQRRQVATIELQSLEQQVREVEQEEQRLSLMEQRLAMQIEAFHAQLEVIAARYSAAEAQVRMQEVLTGISEELADLGTALRQAEEKTEHMQARASAIDQLVEAGVLEMPGLAAGDAFERQLAQLDVGKAVEDQLAALKREVGGQPPPAASGS